MAVAPHGLELLGDPHLPHSSFADEVQEAVRADAPRRLWVGLTRTRVRRHGQGVVESCDVARHLRRHPVPPRALRLHPDGELGTDDRQRCPKGRFFGEV